MEQAQAGALLRPMRPESLTRGRSGLGASEARTADGAGASQEMARESAQAEARCTAAPVAMHRLAGLAPFAPRAAAQAGGEAVQGKRLPQSHAPAQGQSALPDNPPVQEQAPAQVQSAQPQLPTHVTPSAPPSATSIDIELSLSPLPDAPMPMPTYHATLIPVEKDAQTDTPKEPLPDSPAPDAPVLPDPLAGLELLAPDLMDEPEDDWPDENEQDAIPTAQMPLPACVPLFDLADAPRARRKWPWAVGGVGAAFALGGALAWYLWHHPMLP